MLDALQLVRNRHFVGLPAFIHGGVLLDDVDVATEALGCTDGQVDGRDLWPEGGLELVQHRVVVGVLAVHLVDEHEPGQPAGIGQAPHLIGPHFDAGARIHHHDRGVHRRQRLYHVGLEVGVAGRIDEGDADVLVLERADGQVDALLALLLVRVPIERRGTGINASQSLDRARIEEHRLREARLAGATVGDERDVPDLVGRGGLHPGSLRMRGTAETIASGGRKGPMRGPRL